MRGLFWQEIQDLLTKQNAATQPKDTPLRGPNDVKIEKKQIRVFSLAPFVLFGLVLRGFCCCRIFLREYSSVITSLPQRGLAFRSLPFDLPPVLSIFYFLPYYSSVAANILS